MSAPLVSVIIPCRNAARWIGDAVRSAATQSGVEVDLIVVDDGSTDESATVAEGAAPGRVRLIRQPPRGVSQARTAGTAAARGTFLQYLDADDVLLPETLGARVRALDATGADVACCDWIRWREDDTGACRDEETVARTIGERPDVELLTDAWWPPGALLYRRDIVRRIGPWRDDLPVIQDARFALDAARFGARFVRVPGAGLRYRVRADSLSRADPVAFLRDCLHSATQVHDDWAGERALDAARAAALVSVYGALARALFSLDRSASTEALRRAHSLDPSYVPGPRSLRTLARLIGYAPAEVVAARWRSVKRRWKAAHA